MNEINTNTDTYAIHTPLCIDDLKLTLRVIEVAIKSKDTDIKNIGRLLELYRKYETVINEFDKGEIL